MNDAFVGSLIFNKNGGGGGASAMSDLTDVAITSPSEGETLVYDSTSEKWVNGTGSAPALDDLTDVDVTTPSNGDTLVYDSANSKWVNGQGGGKQTALTQAQYDALVQAGTVDPTVEYFITDGIPYVQPFIQGDLTVEASLGWQLRQKYFIKNGICFIDIILGTDQNGFSEEEKICSGAPIPQGMTTASLIGLCDGGFYRFYVDGEGDVYCRYPISAQYKEVIIFGSYPTNQ